MPTRNRVASLFLSLLPVLGMAWAGGAAAGHGADNEVVVLVAKPQFHDPLYGETIVIASPMGGDQHVGFILNRPTTISLAEAFPGRSSAKTVRDPVFLGGPTEANALFALVASSDSPGRGSLQLSDELYLVIAQDTVGRVIESEPGRARFFAGAVVWKPGELQQELRRGAWYVLNPETEVVLPSKTEGLWETLVRRAELREKGI